MAGKHRDMAPQSVGHALEFLSCRSTRRWVINPCRQAKCTGHHRVLHFSLHRLCFGGCRRKLQVFHILHAQRDVANQWDHVHVQRRSVQRRKVIGKVRVAKGPLAHQVQRCRWCIADQRRQTDAAIAGHYRADALAQLWLGQAG